MKKFCSTKISHMTTGTHKHNTIILNYVNRNVLSSSIMQKNKQEIPLTIQLK